MALSPSHAAWGWGWQLSGHWMIIQYSIAGIPGLSWYVEQPSKQYSTLKCRRDCRIYKTTSVSLRLSGGPFIVWCWSIVMEPMERGTWYARGNRLISKELAFFCFDIKPSSKGILRTCLTELVRSSILWKEIQACLNRYVNPLLGSPDCGVHRCLSHPYLTVLKKCIAWNPIESVPRRKSLFVRFVSLIPIYQYLMWSSTVLKFGAWPSDTIHWNMSRIWVRPPSLHCIQLSRIVTQSSRSVQCRDYQKL